MRKIIFLLVYSFIIISCNHPDDKEVKNSFASFNEFHQQKKDFREIPTQILSKNLIYYIDLAEQKEKQSAENIRNSNFPTDKPDIIEGDVFSSLYEGFNEYKILDCTIKNDTARLRLELKNTDFKPITTWNDECLMIKENGKWKIDNFIFGDVDENNFQDTQTIFKSFMHFENASEK